MWSLIEADFDLDSNKIQYFTHETFHFGNFDVYLYLNMSQLLHLLSR